MNLTNKTAIITGAAGGIGKQTAMLFTEADAKLVLVDYNSNLLDKVVAEISNCGCNL